MMLMRKSRKQDIKFRSNSVTWAMRRIEEDSLYDDGWKDDRVWICEQRP